MGIRSTGLVVVNLSNAEELRFAHDSKRCIRPGVRSHREGYILYELLAIIVKQ